MGNAAEVWPTMGHILVQQSLLSSHRNMGSPILSSPHNPHGKGAAEKAVDVAKRITAQEAPIVALMVNWATPVAATGHSPSKLMMGRTICTTMPTISRNLVPQWPDPEKVKENDDRAKSAYRYYYNRMYSTMPFADMLVGSAVNIRTNKD